MYKTVVIIEEVEKNIPIILQSKEYKDRFENILTDTQPKDKSAANNLTTRFGQLLVEICEKAEMKYKSKNNSTTTTYHNWFDREM